jgi:membrane-bound metal-dependent hydrolase YbcI (DUF457 family)
MKWINHTFFSVGASLVVAPQYIPIAIVGGTAPDWLESVLRLMGFPVEHRTVTHYLIEVWLFGTFISLIFWFFSIWGKLFFCVFLLWFVTLPLRCHHGNGCAFDSQL